MECLKINGLCGMQVSYVVNATKSMTFHRLCRNGSGVKPYRMMTVQGKQ
jgi:hypothetical protein